MRTVIKMMRNTHRHTGNRALHYIGAPFYVVGLAMVFGHFAGIRTDPALGVAIWLAAVAMFVAGHKIEGNIRSMTPVLLSRLLSKVVRDFVAQRVHFLRA